MLNAKNDNAQHAYVQFKLSNSERYLVVGLGLPLSVTIRVTRVSTMVSVVVVDFLYCLYAQSLHHSRIEGRNQLVSGLALTKYHCKFDNLN